MSDSQKPKRKRKPNWADDAIAFDTGTGEFDRRATIENRETLREEGLTRNVPPNPPPEAAEVNGLDGKTLARIAVYSVIDCGSWKSQSVMQYYIDAANRAKGLCYPSEDTTAKKARVNHRAVRRANRWWRNHGYIVNGKALPFLTIAVRGRQKPDGTRESNAYHIGWVPLIAIVRDTHFDERVRAEADAVLKKAFGQIRSEQEDKSVQSRRTNTVA
jgi:hypothetical protein